MLLVSVMFSCVALVQSKQNVTAKQQACDDSKKEYASEVSKMKAVQNEHYVTAMPRIFEVSLLAVAHVELLSCWLPLSK